MSELLRVTEAARRLGLPVRELLYAVFDGSIETVEVNGVDRVPVAAVERYKAQRAALR
jgi:hypothetical protein